MYSDLVYKFKGIVGKPHFSDQFKKIFICHKKSVITYYYCFCTCFPMQYLASFLVLQLVRTGRLTLFVFLLSCGC